MSKVELEKHYRPSEAENEACRIAGLALSLMEELSEHAEERPTFDWWVNRLVGAAHTVLPGRYGCGPCRDAEAFAARTVVARDLIMEAHAGAGDRKELLKVAADALDALHEPKPTDYGAWSVEA